MVSADIVAQFEFRLRRLRSYRLLCNAAIPLLVAAVAVLVFRWMFPTLFGVLIWVWEADLVVLVLAAVVWLVVSWTFASGRVECPACAGPFTGHFHLWIPKTCQACGYDVTSAHNPAGPGPRRPAH